MGKILQPQKGAEPGNMGRQDSECNLAPEEREHTKFKPHGSRYFDWRQQQRGEQPSGDCPGDKFNHFYIKK